MNTILNNQQIEQKIRRMAYQVYEQNASEEEVVFAGIKGTGYTLASLLREQFAQISEIPTRLVQVSLDKKAEHQTFIDLDCELESLSHKAIVLVDDVLNTGRTLAYSLRPFLHIPVHKLQLAVLVNRSYSKFPIAPDYTGYELSTTLNEHVQVELNTPGAFKAMLF